MSGIKTLLDNEHTGLNDDDMGEAFGRYAMGQELLPLLKAARREVKAFLLSWRRWDMHTVAPASFNQIATTLEGLEAAIADIERPPKEAPAEPVGELSSVVDIPF
tara:strand:- start:924 stop:1238 length:315 start_codon:yes stop_codon:yes gene_type:complete